MAETEKTAIAIIGAGIAGLTAATRLAEDGHRVTVFEKSGGLGGRLATRRAGAARFDHGAPGFTVSDPAFGGRVAWLVAARSAHPWPDGPPYMLSALPGRPFIGLPGASSIARTMATLLDSVCHDVVDNCAGGEIRHRQTVTAISGNPGAWHVTTAEEASAAGPFSAVLITIPAPQAQKLLAASALTPLGTEVLGAISYRPVMSAMAAFDHPLPDPSKPLPAPLEKAMRQSSFPGRGGAGDAWVLHADEAWSSANQDREKDAIAADLLDAFAKAVGPLPEPTYSAGHRWRYALVTRAAGVPALWDGALGVGLCGDWCLGDTVEHAFLSGQAAANAAASTLSARAA